MRRAFLCCGFLVARGLCSALCAGVVIWGKNSIQTIHGQKPLTPAKIKNKQPFRSSLTSAANRIRCDFECQGNAAPGTDDLVGVRSPRTRRAQAIKPAATPWAFTSEGAFIGQQGHSEAVRCWLTIWTAPCSPRQWWRTAGEPGRCSDIFQGSRWPWYLCGEERFRG